MGYNADGGYWISFSKRSVKRGVRVVYKPVRASEGTALDRIQSHAVTARNLWQGGLSSSATSDFDVSSSNAKTNSKPIYIFFQIIYSFCIQAL